MKKKEFVNHINTEIFNGEKILQRIQNLQEYHDNYGDGMANFGYRPRHNYDPEELVALTNDLTLWERRVSEILKCYLGKKNKDVLNEFALSVPRYWANFKSSGLSCTNRNLTTLRSILDRIDFLNPVNDVKPVVEGQARGLENKPYKVFISHSGEDKSFVNELVKLLEFLGVDSPNKLLCSSIKGYQIPTSEDFAEYIMKQFYEYNLFVIIVHSRNYYSSTYSLNEMGAAWVLKTDFFSFLVKGFEFRDMDGVINNRTISVKVDQDDADARLDELKDKLVPLFKQTGFNSTRWETLRDEFLTKVNNLPDMGVKESDEVFSSCYLPMFDRIFTLVDMTNYPHWTFYWAMAGSSKISFQTYRNLEELSELLKRINYHKGYEQYNCLLKNLALLISDYIDLCEEHIEQVGDDEFTIDRFYKKIPYNSDYRILLHEYYEYCYLICDMTLELTRLLNLLLERIREKVPDYHIEDGVFVIDTVDRIKTEYQNNEKTNTPYPGLRCFVRERSTRNYCYSKTDNLNFIRMKNC